LGIELTMAIVFKIAALGMGLHVVLSILLLAILRNDSLADELFALPNAWLGPRPSPLGLRLLRAKYFLPWVALPGSMAQQPPFVHGLLLISRLAGAAFPCLMIIFLVLMIFESGG
jgi:hypothetical protein